MTQYKIERWDAILLNGVRVPAIYIKPDISFLEFISINNNTINTIIHNTDTSYDDKKYTAVINSSAYYPNCRLNFYEETGLYIIAFDSPWIGYPHPDKLGNVNFYGF